MIIWWVFQNVRFGRGGRVLISFWRSCLIISWSKKQNVEPSESGRGETPHIYIYIYIYINIYKYKYIWIYIYIHTYCKYIYIYIPFLFSSGCSKQEANQTAQRARGPRTKRPGRPSVQRDISSDGAAVLVHQVHAELWFHMDPEVIDDAALKTHG